MSDQISQPAELPNGVRMYELVVGYVASRAISVAAKLGVADLIAEAPKTVDELARATKTHPPSLRRLLLMLASIGIFAEGTDGRFRHTPLSETLRSDDSQSMRNYAVLCGEPWVWKPWADLMTRSALVKWHSIVCTVPRTSITWRNIQMMRLFSMRQCHHLPSSFPGS